MGQVSCWTGFIVYISVSAVTAAIGSALTAAHFGKEPQSKQRALAPTLGTSPRLGVPVIRHGFGGPPPRAIHGAGRLNRHPCRFTPQIHVEFRPACLTGRLRSRSQARSRADQERVDICLMNGDLNCGSWLACDAGNSVHQINQGDAIAGKPAPTFGPRLAVRKPVGPKAAALCF